MLAECLIWYSIITKKILVISNPLLSLLPIVTVIALGNYFFFLHNDNWKAYEKQFKDYDKKRGKFGGILVFAVIIVIVCSVVFSFYKLAQIDWKQYR